MSTQASGPGRAFYDRHIALLQSDDIEALMRQYHDDARLIGLEYVVEGKEALRTHMANYLENLGFLQVLSTDKFIGTDDSVFFEATVKVAAGTARVYDVFMLRDDKIERHFTGMISFTPNP